MVSGFSGLNLSIDDVVRLFPRPRLVQVMASGATCTTTAQREMGRVLAFDDGGALPSGRAFVTIGTRGGAWRLDGELHRDRRTGRAFVTVHRGARFNRRGEQRLVPPRNGVRLRAVGEPEWRRVEVLDLSRSGMQFTGRPWPLFSSVEIDGLGGSDPVRARVVRCADRTSALRFQRLLSDQVAAPASR